MAIIYKGSRNLATGVMDWTGTIKTIARRVGFIEANVEARGSCFHIIIGRSMTGNFLCVPNWNIGTEISELSDTFWNSERIWIYHPKIPEADICSITCAVAEIGKLIKF